MSSKKQTQATGNKSGEGRKCPVTLEEFRQAARSLSLTIEGQAKILPTKEFNTGSFGWFTNEKAVVRVGDKEVRVQCNIQLTVIGSKDLNGEE